MIFFINSRKGQSATEFIVVLAFSLIFLVTLLVTFQSRLIDMEENREKAVVEQLFNLATSELDFAVMSPPVYERTFYLPNTIDGRPYDIRIEDGVEVVIDYMGVRHVRFLTNEVEGSFEVNKNVIYKDHSGTYLNSDVSEVDFLNIEFVDPTPNNNDVFVNEDITIRASSSTPNNPHYSFLDWDNSLVGWWRFENGNANDESSYNNNGILHGVVPVDEGAFGRAMRFNRSQNTYISVPSSPSISPTSEISFGGWIKTSSEHTGLGVITKGPASGNYDYMLYFTSSGSSVSFYIRDSGNNADWISYSFNTHNNQWNQYFAVFDGDFMRLYVNGVQRAHKNTGLTNIRGSNEALNIGRGWGRYFDGFIDEVLVFDRALSAGEIRSLYSASANQYNNDFSLEKETHSFKAYAVDSEGDKAETEERSIEVLEHESPVSETFTNTETGRHGTIQSWTVPHTGTYRITAYGAQGGGSYGGRGAKISGEFELNEGEKIEILVGQEGESPGDNSAGGGGGTFVVRENALNEDDIFVIAGGGGGNHGTSEHQSIADASIMGDGKDSVGEHTASGGSNGDGGDMSNPSNSRGGGGAGFSGDGGAGGTGAYPTAALSFLNGGEGGYSSWNNNYYGGFGGGGGALSTGWRGSGGGGGYSGGGGAQRQSDSPDHAGGGGGSYNAGANQDNEAGVRLGHGMVVIESI